MKAARTPQGGTRRRTANGVALSFASPTPRQGEAVVPVSEFATAFTAEEIEALRARPATADYHDTTAGPLIEERSHAPCGSSPLPANAAVLRRQFEIAEAHSAAAGWL
jgi:hypothetical protein